MSSFEESFEAACKSGDLPGVVMMATNSVGWYASSRGVHSFSEIPKYVP